VGGACGHGGGAVVGYVMSGIGIVGRMRRIVFLVVGKVVVGSGQWECCEW